MTEMHEMGDTQHVPEKLDADQWQNLAPLMQLASLGNPKLAASLQAMKPGEIKRQERKKEVIEALKEHGTIVHAAAATGYAPSTIYRWRASDPQFDREVDEFLHSTYIEELEASMFRIATSKDPKVATAAVRAGEFLMKAEDREKYGDQLKTESTQTVNHMVQVVHSVRDTMREEQQAKLASLQARTITVEPSNSDASLPALTEGEER